MRIPPAPTRSLTPTESAARFYAQFSPKHGSGWLESPQSRSYECSISRAMLPRGVLPGLYLDSKKPSIDQSAFYNPVTFRSRTHQTRENERLNERGNWYAKGYIRCRMFLGCRGHIPPASRRGLNPRRLHRRAYPRSHPGQPARSGLGHAIPHGDFLPLARAAGGSRSVQTVPGEVAPLLEADCHRHRPCRHLLPGGRLSPAISGEARLGQLSHQILGCPGWLLGPEERQQNEAADIVGKALLPAVAQKSLRQPQQRQALAQRVGRHVAGLPVIQADQVIRRSCQNGSEPQDQRPPHHQDDADNRDSQRGEQVTQSRVDASRGRPYHFPQSRIQHNAG